MDNAQDLVVAALGAGRSQQLAVRGENRRPEDGNEFLDVELDGKMRQRLACGPVQQFDRPITALERYGFAVGSECWKDNGTRLGRGLDLPQFFAGYRVPQLQLA